MGATGTPDIVARGRLDAEAVAVDVRTLQMTSDMDGPLVRFLYFAYYGSAEWFGFVGFRSDVTFAGGRLETSRLPASYLKLTKPDMQRMEGAIGPAGGGAGSIRLMTMAFGDQAEVEREFVVPVVGAGSVSGIEVLRRVPPDTGPSMERPVIPVNDRASTSVDQLVGCWRIEQADGGIDGTTPTDIEFLPGGLADYCVHVGGGWHVMPLVFRIEGERPGDASAPAHGSAGGALTHPPRAGRYVGDGARRRPGMAAACRAAGAEVGGRIGGVARRAGALHTQCPAGRPTGDPASPVRSPATEPASLNRGGATPRDGRRPPGGW